MTEHARPHLSRLVYGAWRLKADPDGAEPARILAKIEACLELGIHSFDHADIYGDYQCEELFGRALAESPALREKMQLVTKCGIMLVSPQRPEHRIKHYDTSAAHIVASAEASLRALRTDWIDVLLIHRPDPLMNPDEVCTAFESLRSAGKVRFFGVSNFTPSQLDVLQSRLPFPLVTNQIELSVLRPEPLFDGTVDQCQIRRISPMAWSPFGGGALFRSDAEGPRRVRAALANVGEELGGHSIDQVALAWLLRHPSHVLPVVGTGSIDRIRSAAAALKLPMTRTQWFTITAASTGHDFP